MQCEDVWARVKTRITFWDVHAAIQTETQPVHGLKRRWGSVNMWKMKFEACTFWYYDSKFGSLKKRRNQFNSDFWECSVVNWISVVWKLSRFTSPRFDGCVMRADSSMYAYWKLLGIWPHGAGLPWLDLGMSCRAALSYRVVRSVDTPFAIYMAL